MTIAAGNGAEAFFRGLRGAFERTLDMAPLTPSSPNEPDATRTDAVMLQAWDRPVPPCSGSFASP